MKLADIILFALGLALTFGKDNENGPFEEFYLEEGYLKTKRCDFVFSRNHYRKMTFTSGLSKSALNSS